MKEENEQSAVEKRRELRRRRILANQENRMKKLMGQTETEEVPSSHSEEATATAEIAFPGSEAQDSIVASLSNHTSQHEESHTHARSGGAQLLDSLISSALQGNLSGLSPSSSSSPPSSHPLVSPFLSAVTAPNGGDMAATTNQILNSLSDNQTHVNDEDTSAKTADHTFYRLRQLMCLMIGILVRLSLLTTFGQEYVQTMVYPFISYEIAVIGYQKGAHMDLSSQFQGGGMWLTVLQLSGIRTDFIHTYKQAMGILTGAGDDFALYLFAFVITHLFL